MLVFSSTFTRPISTPSLGAGSALPVHHVHPACSVTVTAGNPASNVSVQQSPGGLPSTATLQGQCHAPEASSAPWNGQPSISVSGAGVVFSSTYGPAPSPGMPSCGVSPCSQPGTVPTTANVMNVAVPRPTMPSPVNHVNSILNEGAHAAGLAVGGELGQSPPAFNVSDVSSWALPGNLSSLGLDRPQLLSSV